MIEPAMYFIVRHAQYFQSADIAVHYRNRTCDKESEILVLSFRRMTKCVTIIFACCIVRCDPRCIFFQAVAKRDAQGSEYIIERRPEEKPIQFI